MLRCFGDNARGLGTKPRGTDLDNATSCGAAATSRQNAGERRSVGRLAVILAAVTLSATLAGCGMSSLTSGLGGGMFGSSSTSGSAAT